MAKHYVYLFSCTLLAHGVGLPCVSAQQETEIESRINNLLMLEDYQPEGPNIRDILQYGDRAIPVLRKILSAPQESDLDSLRASKALIIVAEMGDSASEFSPVVRRQLLAPTTLVRVRAVEALAAIGSVHDTPVFVAMLNDPDIDVRRESIQALGKLGDQSSLLALEIWRKRAAEADKTRPVSQKLLRSAIPRYVDEAQTSIRKRLSKSQE